MNPVLAVQSYKSLHKMAVPAISRAGLAEHGFLCCWDTVSQGWRGALSGLNSCQLLQDGSGWESVDLPPVGPKQNSAPWGWGPTIKTSGNMNLAECWQQKFPAHRQQKLPLLNRAAENYPIASFSVIKSENRFIFIHKWTSVLIVQDQDYHAIL